MSTFKALIFDIDNTLYDYDYADKKAYDEVYNYLFSIYQIDYDLFISELNYQKSLIKSNLGETASSHNRIIYFKKLCFSLFNNKEEWISLALKLNSIYETTFYENMIPAEGIEDLFKELKSNNIKIGICTDMTCEVQLKKLVQLNLDKYITAIETSEENGKEKPDPNFYKRICLALQEKEEDCLFIGDSESRDVIGPRKVNINSINVEDFSEYCNR